MSGRINKGVRFQAPRGPRKILYAQERADAEANRQKMRDFIEDRGRVGVQDLVEHMNFKAAKVREYASRLMELKLVKAERVVYMGIRKGGPTTKTFYSIVGEGEQAHEDEDLPRRPVRKSWLAHHHRDSLVAALFGPARKSA